MVSFVFSKKKNILRLQKLSSDWVIKNKMINKKGQIYGKPISSLLHSKWNKYKKNSST